MLPSEPRNSQIRNSRRLQLQALVTLVLFLSGALTALSQPIAPALLGVHWNEGAKHCALELPAPLQVHAYNPRTFIIRQNPCASGEANFMYLLIGSNQALLIDTGAVESTGAMPLAETVTGLLPDRGAGKIPLLVVHTHKHLTTARAMLSSRGFQACTSCLRISTRSSNSLDSIPGRMASHIWN
jgi:hypothetical protein